MRGDKTVSIQDKAVDMTTAWSESGVVADIALRLNRYEVEPLAALFVATGHTEDASVLLECWIESEIADGEADEDRYEVEDSELVDHWEDESNDPERFSVWVHAWVGDVRQQAVEIGCAPTYSAAREIELQYRLNDGRGQNFIVDIVDNG